MKQTALTLLTTLLVGTAFAASHTGAPMPEAMKPGNTQAEDAAQKNTDDKAKLGAAPSGPMPEAMKPGNEKAEDVAKLVMAACQLVGVKNVFRIGGAQAMAALAFGTRPFC